MRVTLNVIGHAQEFFPGGLQQHAVVLEEPRSISQILKMLGVKPELVMRVISCGHVRSKDYTPEDGEELTLVSPPSGG